MIYYHSFHSTPKQGAWGFRGKIVQAIGLTPYCYYISKKKKKSQKGYFLFHFLLKKLPKYNVNDLQANQMA